MSATFEQLLASNTARVHRAAIGLLPNEQEAREVAQEALGRAWAARDRYDPSRPFYPWLYTIVRNACRDAWARGRHRALPGLDTERVASPHPDAITRLSQVEAQQRVHRGMARLSEDQREVLSLRHFQDLSYAEMAQVLDVPQGTVMSRLYRARRALLAAMNDEEQP